MAYATTIVEIAHQSAALGFVPTAIVHRSGSAVTQAGLAGLWRGARRLPK